MCASIRDASVPWLCARVRICRVALADKGSQQGTTTKPQANPYLTGSFLFVSVAPDGKSAPVNLLQTTNEVHPRTIRAAPPLGRLEARSHHRAQAEKRMFALGEEAKSLRKRERLSNLETTEPLPEEVFLPTFAAHPARPSVCEALPVLSGRRSCYRRASAYGTDPRSFAVLRVHACVHLISSIVSAACVVAMLRRCRCPFCTA